MNRLDEKQVCYELEKWFKYNGVMCWQNYGDNLFTIKGSRKKPDLVIFSANINQYIVLEVKIGKVSKDIHDACKIFDVYYKEYNEGKVRYMLSGKDIKISSFALATRYSPAGRLFDEDLLRDEKSSDDNWKKINKKYGIEPKQEYLRTHDKLRSMWASWRLYRKKIYMPGLGIIVSDNLNKPETKLNKIDKPILFDMQWEYNRWKVKQKML